MHASKHRATTVREYKQLASTLCAIPSSRLLLFATAPLADDTQLLEDGPGVAYHLAVGSAGRGFPSDIDPASSPSLLADACLIEERVRRMQTSITIHEEVPHGELLGQQLRARARRAESEAGRLSSVMEAAELRGALRRAERARVLAERRVLLLERQLSEAHRYAPGAAAFPQAMPTEAPQEPDQSAESRRSVAPTALGSTASQVLADAGREMGEMGDPMPTEVSIGQGVVEHGSRATATAFLLSLRREKSIDVGCLPPEHAHLASAIGALSGALQRSLALLAEDIYRDETHAISELVQNADDNAYADGVLPTWSLHSAVAADGRRVLWTANNEVGMADADVRALCDAGASSKAGRRGLIGRKGIGFKAVFKLSTSPHVLSRSFAFRFDLDANGRLGYVLPEPLDEPTVGALPRAARLMWQLGDSTGEGAPAYGSTVIYLPLREGAPNVDALRTALCERGTCLLFLRRLRRLEWCDHQTGEHAHAPCPTPHAPRPMPHAPCHMHRCDHQTGERFAVGRTTISSLSSAEIPPEVSSPAGAADGQVASAVADAAADAPSATHVPRLAESWRVSVEELHGSPGADTEAGSGGVRWAQRYLRCVATLRVPPALRGECTGAPTTDVILALPIPSSPTASPTPGSCGEALSNSVAPPRHLPRAQSHQIHCFLPVRDVGLRFAVHAEFATVSSRDDLHDSPFNRWLRDALPSLFVAAVAAQSAVASSTPSPALSFLPRGLRLAEPFWQPFVDGAIRELRSSALPALLDESGTLCPLSHLVSRPQGVSRSFLTSDQLHAATGLRFIDEAQAAADVAERSMPREGDGEGGAAEADSSVTSAALSELGIRPLTLRQMATAVAGQLHTAVEASWLVELYSACFHIGRRGEDGEAEGGLMAASAIIRSLAMFPMRTPPTAAAAESVAGTTIDGSCAPSTNASSAVATAAATVSSTSAPCWLTLTSCDAGPIYTGLPEPHAQRSDAWLASALPSLRLLHPSIRVAIAAASPHVSRGAERLLHSVGIGPASAADVVAIILHEHQANLVLRIDEGRPLRRLARLHAQLRVARCHQAHLPVEPPPLVLVPARRATGENVATHVDPTPCAIHRSLHAPSRVQMPSPAPRRQ